MKKFNIAGVCIPQVHYMVNIEKKLEKIIELIESNDYFAINRARQYGKTTTLTQIHNRLKDKYLVLEISFEGIGDKAFESDRDFCSTFINLIQTRLEQNNAEDKVINEWKSELDKIDRLELLSKKITNISKISQKEIILMVDEVDKSSNNQLFLHFLGMLRNKYLDRSKGYDHTFKSVILAGVYDVKNLKIKLRPDEERKYNSPWNIAADFDVDMSFDPQEISTMLVEYEKDYKTGMDIEALSHEIYRFTSGYPFLVSKLCKLIDEKLDKDWTLKGIEEAVKRILDEKNTLFDDLVKNIENNKELYDLVWKISLMDEYIPYSNTDPIIGIGEMFAILKNENKRVAIRNLIFSQLIYNHMIVAKVRKGESTSNTNEKYVVDGKLNMELVLNKFQEVMHDEFRDKDSKFIEREGRLLFLCFLKPIINGKGFYYVEPQTRMDNRMDVVVNYGEEQYIVELKIWHGENYLEEAVEQLAGYLDSTRNSKGYLISYSFNKNKEYTKEWIKHKDKDIYAIVV